MLSAPVAVAMFAEYAVPTVAPASVGAYATVPGAPTVMVTSCLAGLSPLALAVISTVALPSDVGTPTILPSAVSAMPAGRVPEVSS